MRSALLFLVLFFCRAADAQDFTLNYDVEWSPGGVKRPPSPEQIEAVRAKILAGFSDTLKQLAPDIFPYAKLGPGRKAPYLLLYIWKAEDKDWQFEVQLNGGPFLPPVNLPIKTGSALANGDSIQTPDWWGNLTRNDLTALIAQSLQDAERRRKLGGEIVRKQGVQVCERSTLCAVLNLDVSTNAMLAKSAFIIDYASGRVHSHAIGSCADYNKQFSGLVVNHDYPLTAEDQKGDPKDLPAVLGKQDTFYLVNYVKSFTQPDCKPRPPARTPSGVGSK